MEIQLINDTVEWNQIRHSWNDMVRTCQKDDNPFISFEWLWSWWNVFGSNRELCILVAKENGKIEGLAAFMITPKFGFRICEFIGTGRTDMLDFIVPQPNRNKIIFYFLKFLKNNIDWSLINIRDYAHSAQSLLNIVETVGLKGDHFVGDVSPYIPINNKTWDDFLAEKSGKHRGNIKRAIRKAEADRDVDIQLERDYNPQLLEEIAFVEANSWKVSNGMPRLSGLGKDFFRSFCKSFSGKGWLNIWTLRYKRKLLAYCINFNHASKIYNYNVAYDKNYMKYLKTYSVGSVLTSIAIRDSFLRKQLKYDFLRGDETYKWFWTKENKKLSYIGIYKKELRSFIIFSIDFEIRFFLRNNQFVFNLYKKIRERSLL